MGLTPTTFRRSFPGLEYTQRLNASTAFADAEVNAAGKYIGSTAFLWLDRPIVDAAESPDPTGEDTIKTDVGAITTLTILELLELVVDSGVTRIRASVEGNDCEFQVTAQEMASLAFTSTPEGNVTPLPSADRLAASLALIQSKITV